MSTTAKAQDHAINVRPRTALDGVNPAPSPHQPPPASATRCWLVIALAFVAFALVSVPLVVVAASGPRATAGAVVPTLGAAGGLALWLQGMWVAR